jgi:DNA adenine methylase
MGKNKLFTLSEIKPPVKWAGSKFNQPQVYDIVRDLQFEYKELAYIELCAGGLGMTYRILPKQAFLFDNNPHLIAYYQAVQQFGEYRNYQYYESIPYESLKVIFNAYLKETDIVKLANDPDFPTIFHLIIQRGFNGVYRVNSSNQFNIPEGTKSKNQIFTTMPPDVKQHQLILNDWQFRHGDVLETIEQLDDNSFVYYDPPYYKTGVSYGSRSFDYDKHMVSALKLSRLKCPVVISNSANPMIISMYERYGFHVNLIEENRTIACNGDRSPVKCIIATKNIG